MHHSAVTARFQPNAASVSAIPCALDNAACEGQYGTSGCSEVVQRPIAAASAVSSNGARAGPAGWRCRSSSRRSNRQPVPHAVTNGSSAGHTMLASCPLNWTSASSTAKPPLFWDYTKP